MRRLLYNVPMVVPNATTALEGTGAGSLVHVPCDLCGADDPAPLFEKHGLRIVRCRSCSFAYVDPRPGWEDVAEIYRGESYYRNDNTQDYGYGDYLGEQRELLIPLFQRRIVDIERHHPNRGRLLDIGCATGLLLDAATEAGWQAEGVDVSAYAVETCRARGLTAHLGMLEESRFPAGRFDAVVMDDTVEHLPDPRRALEEVHRVLAPGGLFTVNTCDEGGWLRRVMGRHWFHYKPLEHLCYFDRAALSRLLVETGFKPVETRISGKIVTMRYLCQRLRTYNALAARIALGSVGRLRVAERPFFLPIGEFVTFATRQ